MEWQSLKCKCDISAAKDVTFGYAIINVELLGSGGIV
jgi:hypothetical protein